jgi:tape measure domain-containing protein
MDSSQFSGGMGRALRESNAFVTKMSAQFASLRNVFMGGAVGVAGGHFLSSVIGQAAEFEKYERMLSGVSGGMTSAKQQLQELKVVARQPGLDLESAVQATVRLRTMGYTAAEAAEYMQALANKVAQFGGGGNEMAGVIQAFSQISSKGNIFAEEINQIAERMPGIREDMKKAFGTANTEELQKMGISSKVFIDTLLNEWSKAPKVASGLAEEVAALGMTFKSLRAYAGEAFAPIVTITNEFLRGAKALHEIATFEFDKLFFGGAHAKALAEQRKIAKEQQELADEMASKKTSAESQVASDKRRLETLEKIRKELREQDNIRDAAYSAKRSLVATDEEELEIVQRQLDLITDKDETIESINNKLRDKQGMDDAEVEHYQKVVGLLRDQEAIQDRINQKEGDRINDEVDKEMMSPRERKAKMRADNDRERAEKRVFKREENKALKDAEKKFNEDKIDNIKKGQFFNKDAERMKQRAQQAERWSKALQDSAQSLKNIESILKTLATA